METNNQMNMDSFLRLLAVDSKLEKLSDTFNHHSMKIERPYLLVDSFFCLKFSLLSKDY